jgi:hypothetical protein
MDWVDGVWVFTANDRVIVCNDYSVLCLDMSGYVTVRNSGLAKGIRILQGHITANFRAKSMRQNIW